MDRKQVFNKAAESSKKSFTRASELLLRRLQTRKSGSFGFKTFALDWTLFLLFRFAGESFVDAWWGECDLVYRGHRPRPHPGGPRPPGTPGDGSFVVGDVGACRRDHRQRHDAPEPGSCCGTRRHRQPAVQEGGKGQRRLVWSEMRSSRSQNTRWGFSNVSTYQNMFKFIRPFYSLEINREF